MSKKESKKESKKKKKNPQNQLDSRLQLSIREFGEELGANPHAEEIIITFSFVAGEVINPKIRMSPLPYFYKR